MNTTIERTAEAGLAAATGSGFFASYEPDPIGVMLGAGYNRFATADGMDGLAKITGDRLDVLAVVASKAGAGQFRRFIASAKLAFKIVAVWEDWNPIVGAALKRYGFHPATCKEADGEVNHGWQWESQNDPVEARRESAPHQQ